MERLAGKVALVTGAAMGMGAEHAKLFIEEGARVVLTDLQQEAGEQLAAELGPNALFVTHDVTDPASWEDVLSKAEAAFGPVTVLVNNAGLSGPTAHTADLSDQDYERTVAVDQHGVFYGMRAVIPGMIAAGGGSIVNISSVAGFAHSPGTPNVAYTSSKFAVRGMTKTAAVEYGGQGIRVNSIHPGAIFTPMLESVLDEAAQTAISARIPLGRMARPSEVSQAVLFFASDDASYVSGTELIVDGGMQAQ